MDSTAKSKSSGGQYRWFAEGSSTAGACRPEPLETRGTPRTGGTAPRLPARARSHAWRCWSPQPGAYARRCGCHPGAPELIEGPRWFRAVRGRCAGPVQSRVRARTWPRHFCLEHRHEFSILLVKRTGSHFLEIQSDCVSRMIGAVVACGDPGERVPPKFPSDCVKRV